ncbi:MAG: hypothetical protein AAF479_06890 [Pseudomonadota bacterium]
MSRPLGFLGQMIWILILTVLTQIGGVAWIFSFFFRRRWLGFLALYTAMSIAAIWVAPLLGRVPLPCIGEPMRMQSLTFCALNRHYVVPELAEVLSDTAHRSAERHPGTVTLVLDANFPFIDGYPLLPHLSHDDGRKADIAFHYADSNGLYLPGETRSPIGYFAFEQGPTDCPERILSLRWNLGWLQPYLRSLPPDVSRMQTAIALLNGDRRVGKIFLEPHLVRSWQVGTPKVRFQGCRAARHDDHIHVQL